MMLETRIGVPQRKIDTYVSTKAPGYAYSAGRFRFRKSAPIGMRKSFRQTV